MISYPKEPVGVVGTFKVTKTYTVTVYADREDDLYDAIENEEIDEDDLKILLKLVLIHLMKRYELVKDCDRYIIEKLLDTVIKLVLMTPIKQGLFCCF